ncbi:MAG TPA: hypothetical protein VF881_08405 [Polyangiaceae bacterium]
MRAARRNPDGTFDYRGERYRVEDRGRDHFAIRRLGDAAIVGGLRFASDRYDAQVEIEGPVQQADAVRAIARLLDEGRGLLPLQ